MISRLRGILREMQGTQLLIDVNGIGYEVLVAPSILQEIRERIGETGEIELVTNKVSVLACRWYDPPEKRPFALRLLIVFTDECDTSFFTGFQSFHCYTAALFSGEALYPLS